MGSFYLRNYRSPPPCQELKAYSVFCSSPNFEGQYFAVTPGLAGTAYDVSPDGQRFLMVKETDRAASNAQINVVLNWSEELKRRVPAAK